MTVEDERPEGDRPEGMPEGQPPGDQPPEDQAREEQAAEEQAAEEPVPEEQSGGEQEGPAEQPPEGQSAPASEGEAPEGEAPEGEAPEAQASQGEPPEERPSEPEPAGEGAPEESAAPRESRPEERSEPRRKPGDAAAGEQAEVVPGADLEPDLVLDAPARGEQDEYGDAAYAERYAEPDAEAEEPDARPDEAPARDEVPAARTPMELAADARYQATGKRKTSVARVILKPGSGSYTVNGRTLEQFFPRFGLQATARQPLTTAGYDTRMDVVARLHGGGVSSQAGALRHGVARALVEADPSLREDLKRRGYLTRDPRAKERKKAGLKKARKRPQFSKR